VLYRLMSWMSPAFPVGAYAYSHGLETDVVEGLVTDRAALTGWIDALLRHGAGLLDAVALREAYQASTQDALQAIGDELIALTGSAEGRTQTLVQGRAFLEATDDAWPTSGKAGVAGQVEEPVSLPLPVAVGRVCAAHDIPLDAAVQAYLSEFAANLVSAGVRLVPLGQRDGQRAIAALEQPVLDVAEASRGFTLATVATSAPAIDLACLQHETLYTRLFRS